MYLCNITVKEFLVSLCPHDGAMSHAPEDHRISSKEICRQSGVQLPTYRRETQWQNVVCLKIDVWEEQNRWMRAWKNFEEQQQKKKKKNCALWNSKEINSAV